MKPYLNELETSELQKLNDNKALLGAIKKVLLETVYYEGTLEPGKDPGDPIKNFLLIRASQALQTIPSVTNEMLGQQLRADTQALRIVEIGFQEIEKFKKSDVSVGKKNNPAR